MKDNIIMEKIWEDSDLIELKIICNAEYIEAFQSCYIPIQFLEKVHNEINAYIDNSNQNCYLEFGKKTGNYTPAFSMDILKMDKLGRIKIEVDMEISDNDERKHRCSFFIESEIGLLEQFNNKLLKLEKDEIGNKIMLNG